MKTSPPRTVIQPLEQCSLCPRMCGADRAHGKKGYCRAGEKVKIYAFQAHHGEEPALSGTRGSGTIFFSHCTMKCVYCQNYSFSQLDDGEEIDNHHLAVIMLRLQRDGCHNINLVSPTHYTLQIAEAAREARSLGLSIPIVYNTSGYERVETIRSLDGLIDIYLPDMRYSDDALSLQYSDAPLYAEFNRSALKEMHRQVGDLRCNDDGIAVRGLIIRLLVLPRRISGTVDSLRFIAREISKETQVSIMSQYYPAYRAQNVCDLSRAVQPDEYDEVVAEADSLGLRNGWLQECNGLDRSFAGTNLKKRVRIDD